MALSDEQEIDRKLAELHKKQRKHYAMYKLKSFFGIPTKGLDDLQTLILFSILHHNKHHHYSFTILKGIKRFDPDSLKSYHADALRIDESNYVSIFLNADKNLGDFVIGKNIAGKLNYEEIRILKTHFLKHIEDKEFLKAVEDLVKSINRKLARHR